MERDDYYDLQSAADDAGLSLSAYARIVLQRAAKKPLNQSKEKRTVYNPDGEFAQYLATA